MIGKIYGRLTVYSLDGKVKQYKNGSKEKFAICKCECGTVKEVSTWQLKSGHASSCGCYKKEAQRKFRTGEEAAIYHIYRSYTNNAKSRSIEFTLDINVFRQLITQDCFYCGGPPTSHSPVGGSNRKSLTKEWKDQQVVNVTGIDRIDNSLGYTENNCRPCCTTCNKMKLTHNEEDWYIHILKIIKHRKIESEIA